MTPPTYPSSYRKTLTSFASAQHRYPPLLRRPHQQDRPREVQSLRVPYGDDVLRRIHKRLQTPRPDPLRPLLVRRLDLSNRPLQATRLEGRQLPHARHRDRHRPKRLLSPLSLQLVSPIEACTTPEALLTNQPFRQSALPRVRQYSNAGPDTPETVRETPPPVPTAKRPAEEDDVELLPGSKRKRHPPKPR